jgi:hypothetical protein
VFAVAPVAVTFGPKPAVFVAPVSVALFAALTAPVVPIALFTLAAALVVIPVGHSSSFAMFRKLDRRNGGGVARLTVMVRVEHSET